MFPTNNSFSLENIYYGRNPLLIGSMFPTMGNELIVIVKEGTSQSPLNRVNVSYVTQAIKKEFECNSSQSPLNRVNVSYPQITILWKIAGKSQSPLNRVNVSYKQQAIKEIKKIMSQSPLNRVNVSYGWSGFKPQDKSIRRNPLLIGSMFPTICIAQVERNQRMSQSPLNRVNVSYFKDYKKGNFYEFPSQSPLNRVNVSYSQKGGKMKIRRTIMGRNPLLIGSMFPTLKLQSYGRSLGSRNPLLIGSMFPTVIVKVNPGYKCCRNPLLIGSMFPTAVFFYSVISIC